MKTRKFSKILAIILIFAILLSCVNIKVFAEVKSSSTGEITVSGIEAGVTVYAYKIVSVNWDDSANQPKDPPYSWDDNVKTWVDENYQNYSDPEKFYKEFYDEETETVGEAAEFYSELTAAIKKGTISLEPTMEKTVEGTPSFPVEDSLLTGEVTFENCEMGVYLILIENGYLVYSPSVVDLTATYNEENGDWELQNTVEVTVKATKPQITKTVSEKEVDNYSTNSSLSFTISADVPTYLKGAISRTYQIKDEFSGGLVLDTNSIAVTGSSSSGTVDLTEEKEYTITSSESGFTIDFEYDEISIYNTITVTYTATLAQDSSTVLGSVGNSNNATLTYSNNPYVEESSKTQDDSVTVYTYGIEITKVDKADTNKTLSGAEFKLTDGEKNTLYFVKSGEVYYLASEDTSGSTTILGVDSDGLLKIYGLDEGAYYLTETKAPGGYNLSQETYTIVIKDDEKDGLIDDDDAGYTKNDENGIIEITVLNTNGFQLPITGGLGTTLFIAGGIILIVAGIVFLLVYRKKSKE